MSTLRVPPAPTETKEAKAEYLRLKSGTDKDRNKYRDIYTLPYANHFETVLYNMLVSQYGNTYVIVWRGDERHRANVNSGNGIAYDQVPFHKKYLTPSVSPLLNPSDPYNTHYFASEKVSTWYSAYAPIDFEMYYNPELANKTNNMTLTESDVSDLKSPSGEEISVCDNQTHKLNYDLLRLYLRETSDLPILIETKRRTTKDLEPESITTYPRYDFNADKITGFADYLSFVMNGDVLAYCILITKEGFMISEVNPKKEYYLGKGHFKTTWKSGTSDKDKDKYGNNPDSAPDGLVEHTVTLGGLGFVEFDGELPSGSRTGEELQERMETYNKGAERKTTEKALNAIKGVFAKRIGVKKSIHRLSHRIDKGDKLKKEAMDNIEHM